MARAWLGASDPERMQRFALIALLAVLSVGGCKVAPNPPRRRPASVTGLGAPGRAGLEAYRLVDLTHAEDTSVARAAMDSTAGPETRLVAPGVSGGVAAVPMETLVAPALVIDVAGRVAADGGFRLSAADVRAWERRYGRIQPGSLVLLHTGWSRHWGERGPYEGRPAGARRADENTGERAGTAGGGRGDSTVAGVAGAHVPGYGADAVRLLLERRVVGLGIDGPELAPGHAGGSLLAGGVVGLVNLTNLATLPSEGALVVALPVKLAGASSAPLRALALVPDRGR